MSTTIKNVNGKFGELLVTHILANDGTIVKASEKIQLHPYVISGHIHMRCQPRHASIMLYSEYLGLEPGVIADMIYDDWRNINANS